MAALMNRRRFLLAGLLAVPLCAEGQGIGKIPRIGILVPGDPPTRPTLEAFRAALRELGYVEGRTIVFEPRWAGARPLERWPELAIDLARLPVDVIVAGTHEAALAAKKATGDIPIVVTTAHEPFDGLFASLARPGGNVTGLVLFSTGVSGKRVEVLKDAIPTLSRVAVLFSPRAQMPGLIEETVAAAQSLRLDVVRLEVRQSADLEAAFQLAVRERAGRDSGRARSIVQYLRSKDRRALDQASAAVHRGAVGLCRHGRADRLRPEHHGQLAPFRDLRRPDPQGDEAGGAPGGAADPLRAHREQEDGTGHRAEPAGLHPGPGGRGDRVIRSWG
jgi:putative ABC transport system substrate-binding protein